MSKNDKNETTESTVKTKTICLNPQQMWIAEEIAALGRGEKFVTERYELKEEDEVENENKTETPAENVTVGSSFSGGEEKPRFGFHLVEGKTKFKNKIYLLPRQTGKTRIACAAAIARGLSSPNEYILYYVPFGRTQNYVIKEVLIKALNEISKEKSGGTKLYKEYGYDHITLYNDSVIKVCPATHGEMLEKDESVKKVTLVIFDETLEYEPNQKLWRDCAPIRAITNTKEMTLGEVVAARLCDTYHEFTTPPIAVLISKNFYVETSRNCTSDGQHARLDYLDLNYHNPLKNDKHGFVRYPRKEWEIWSYSKKDIGRCPISDVEYPKWREQMIRDSFNGDEAAFTQEYEPHVIELPHDYDTPKKRMVDIFDFFKE